MKRAHICVGVVVDVVVFEDGAPRHRAAAYLGGGLVVVVVAVAWRGGCSLQRFFGSEAACYCKNSAIPVTNGEGTKHGGPGAPQPWETRGAGLVVTRCRAIMSRFIADKLGPLMPRTMIERAAVGTEQVVSVA